MAITTISPITGEVLTSFEALTPEELPEKLEDKLVRAGAAAESYRLATASDRAQGGGRMTRHVRETRGTPRSNARRGYFLSVARARGIPFRQGVRHESPHQARRHTGLSSAGPTRPNCRASER